MIGATGLLGHHAAKAAIEAGYELVVIHRQGSDLSKIDDLEFTARVADLNDRPSLQQALQGLDGVINSAAYYPTVPKPWREEVSLAVTQMENFYNACEEAKVDRVVYVGGSIALAKPPQGGPGDETCTYEQAPEDLTPYVQVKWALDRLAVERAQAGLHVVLGIPSMSFGEHDHGPTTGLLVQKIAKEGLPFYVRGNRNAVYAGDAGRGLVLALEKGSSGERYLLTGENISMDELVTLIAKMAATRPPQSMPMFVARSISALEGLMYQVTKRPPLLSSTAIAVMAAGQFLSGEKAKADLGYVPKVDLSEAIDRTLRWFKVRGYL